MDTQNQFDAQQQPSPTASRTAVNSVEGKELKKDTKTSIYLSNRIEQRTQLLVHLLGLRFVGVLITRLRSHRHSSTLY